MPTLSVYNCQGELLRCASHPTEAMLYHPQPYAPGDYLELTLEAPGYCHLTVDAAIPSAFVYLPTGTMRYAIPFDESMRAHPPTAFAGDKHLVAARVAAEDERYVYRNVAENPADQRGPVDAYPHATANVETRGESVFAARNVIDGFRLSNGHGSWPYQSWGIGERKDAVLTLDFGRPVVIDRAVFYLRADFPHDAYWTQATIVLSDGTEKTVPLTMTAQPQAFDLGTHTVAWLRLERLIKCDMPSAFPALTELQIWGRDAR